MPKKPDHARAMREAHQWLDRLNTNKVKTETLYKFADWRADPANRKAYDEVSKAYYSDLGAPRHIRPTFH